MAKRKPIRKSVRLLLSVSFVFAAVLNWQAVAVAAGPDSSFPANPASGTGHFVFDLEMQVEIDSDRISGPATVYVNSRDGSMALANPHTALWALGMPDIPGLQIHQAVFRHGELMVCGVHPDYGEGCMQMGEAHSALAAAVLGREQAQLYFNSVRLTDQDNAPVDVEGTHGFEHVHGYLIQDRGGQANITFWLDPGRSTVATHMPFLGPGVGVMEDRRSGTNRTVRHAFFDFALAEEGNPLNWLSIHLNSLRRTEHRVDASRYPLVTAFTSENISAAGDLSGWMQTKGREIRALAREMEGCPKDSAGNDCRAGYRERIKRLEDQMQDRVRAFGTAQGLPIPRD